MAIGPLVLGVMVRVLSLFGSAIGGAAGWWIGAQVGGTMTAFMVSMVGTGFGIYWGRRIARDYLGG
jgi:hypothetical protein